MHDNNTGPRHYGAPPYCFDSSFPILVRHFGAPPFLSLVNGFFLFCIVHVGWREVGAGTLRPPSRERSVSRDVGMEPGHRSTSVRQVAHFSVQWGSARVSLLARAWCFILAAGDRGRTDDL